MMNRLRKAWRDVVPVEAREWLRAQTQNPAEERRFRLMLDAIGTAGEGGSEADVRRALEARSGDRRELPREEHRASVVAIGFEDWERFGLWPTFSRMTDFRFVDVRRLAAASGARTLRGRDRRVLERALLRKLEDLEAERPIDLVFLYVDSESVTPAVCQALAGRGIWTVLMGLDDKRRLPRRMEAGALVGQQTLAPEVDLLWTTFRSARPLIASWGGRPWYAPEAADPHFHRPHEVVRDIDVAFVGVLNATRRRLVEYLRRGGFRVEAFGTGWPNGFLSFEETVRLFSRAKVVLGSGDISGLSGVQHLKGRDFEVPMCGAVYLTSFNPELTDWFEVGRDILCYSTQENCAEALHWILRDHVAQERVRRAALERSLGEHTWQKRLDAMLALFPRSQR